MKPNKEFYMGPREPRTSKYEAHEDTTGGAFQQVVDNLFIWDEDTSDEVNDESVESKNESE